MRPSSVPQHSPGRYGRLGAVLSSAVLAPGSVVFAFLSGLSGPPNGGTGTALIGRGLLVSAVAGVAAVGCAWLAMGRRARWPTLSLGLLPAIAEVLWLLLG